MAIPSNILEKDIENMIIKHKDTIHEKGFVKFLKNVDQQVTLPNRSIVDILSWEWDEKEKHFQFQIVELKKDEVDVAALWQLMGYFEEIMQCMGLCKKITIELVLVGGSMANAMYLLSTLGLKVKFLEYHFEYEGLTFWNRVMDDCNYTPYTVQIGEPFEADQQYIDFFNKLIK